MSPICPSSPTSPKEDYHDSRILRPKEYGVPLNHPKSPAQVKELIRITKDPYQLPLPPSEKLSKQQWEARMERYWDMRHNPPEFRNYDRQANTPSQNTPTSAQPLLKSASRVFDIEEGKSQSGSMDKEDEERNSAGLTSEDAAFTKMLERKVHRSLFSKVAGILTYPFKQLFHFVMFLIPLLLWYGPYEFVAYMSWECCGIPIKKLNKNEFLLSRYMNNNLAVKFQLLKLEKEDQLKWMEVWNNIDDTGDDRMDTKEFEVFFGVSDLSNATTKRLFDIFNTQLNGYISFEDFLTTCFQYCPYDREKCIELSFRLISRRGSVFDAKKSCLDLIDFEDFVKYRYFRNKKSTNPKKIASMGLSLFGLIDEDLSGGVNYSEFREFALNNRSLLCVGYFYQSLLRKMAFGENYWKAITVGRKNMYYIDQPFDENMMQRLDFKQVVALGMAPPGSMIKKEDKIPFRDDFPEAWFRNKEKAFVRKKNKKMKQKTSNKLASEAFGRCVKVFSRLMNMNVEEAMRHWKDVHAFQKSMEEDGGQSYRDANMSLQDARAAAQASSVGLTTRKLKFSLMKDFDMEAEVDDEVNRDDEIGDAGKESSHKSRRVSFDKSAKRARKKNERKEKGKEKFDDSLHQRVLRELGVQRQTNEGDLIDEYLSTHKTNLQENFRSQNKLKRIDDTHQRHKLKEIDFGKNVKNRINLRKDLHTKFGIGIGKENDTDDDSIVSDSNFVLPLASLSKTMASIESLQQITSSTGYTRRNSTAKMPPFR